MSKKKTIKLNLQYAGKAEPFIYCDNVVLSIDEYERLKALAARRLKLLRRANSFLDHHEDCVSHLDDNYCDCIIETIRKELVEELGDG